MKYGQNSKDKKDRNEKSVTKTKKLSKFPLIEVLQCFTISCVCSALLIFGLVMSNNEMNQQHLFIHNKIIQQIK